MSNIHGYVQDMCFSYGSPYLHIRSMSMSLAAVVAAASGVAVEVAVEVAAAALVVGIPTGGVAAGIPTGGVAAATAADASFPVAEPTVNLGRVHCVASGHCTH